MATPPRKTARAINNLSCFMRQTDSNSPILTSPRAPAQTNPMQSTACESRMRREQSANLTTKQFSLIAFRPHPYNLQGTETGNRTRNRAEFGTPQKQGFHDTNLNKVVGLDLTGTSPMSPRPSSICQIRRLSRRGRNHSEIRNAPARRSLRLALADLNK